MTYRTTTKQRSAWNADRQRRAQATKALNRMERPAPPPRTARHRAGFFTPAATDLTSEIPVGR